MFKTGDIVKRTKNGNFGDIREGDIVKVLKVLGSHFCIDDDMFYLYNSNNFELLGEEKQMNVKEWLQNNAWFIRIKNEEQFNLVQGWLEENYGREQGNNIIDTFILCIVILT